VATRNEKEEPAPADEGKKKFGRTMRKITPKEPERQLDRCCSCPLLLQLVEGDEVDGRAKPPPPMMMMER
jgi:hypothetical protein